jgi:hypothetical protein
MQLLCSVQDLAAVISYSVLLILSNLLLTLIEEFAFDLDSCLRWGKPTGLVCDQEKMCSVGNVLDLSAFVFCVLKLMQ